MERLRRGGGVGCRGGVVGKFGVGDCGAVRSAYAEAAWAGSGSYEPVGRDAIAVESSALTRAQRSGRRGVCVATVADSLPFAD